MKPTSTAFVFLLFISTSAFSQSKSFYSLKEKFSGSKDVYAFQTSGFFARTILWMAGEHEFTKAIKEVKNINLIVIPKAAFKAHQVTLAGFQKLTMEDSFEELAHVRDHGDDVRLLMQSSKKNKDNRYLVLIDSNQEIVVIEVRGYIDPNLMRNDIEDIAYDN